jgi:hypothetical protein
MIWQQNSAENNATLMKSVSQCKSQLPVCNGDWADAGRQPTLRDCDKWAAGPLMALEHTGLSGRCSAAKGLASLTKTCMQQA